MIPATVDHYVHHKETLLVKVMKSLWYTVVLWLLIFGGSVIFMGIEGNYTKLVGWRNMEELEQFNKSLYKVRGPFFQPYLIVCKQSLRFSCTAFKTLPTSR